MSIHTKHSAADCEVCAAQQEADAIGAIPTAGHRPGMTPDPFPLLSPPLRSLAEAAGDAVKNRPLVVSRRQLFEPPLSDDCDFRSLPLLLRAVAAWMEASNVEDPEFDGLTIERVFPTVEGDECRYCAVLYWHKEDDKL